MGALIHEQLPKVMRAVGAVAKSKKNTQQNYQFRGVDDVVAHVQAIMAEHGVTCVPRVVHHEREALATKSGGTMASVRLLVEHHFYAADGSSVVATTLGEAMDAGDKASNKAMSAALKYALTETLLIPTYEVDRDTEESSPEMAATAATKADSAMVATQIRASTVKLWSDRVRSAPTYEGLQSVMQAFAAAVTDAAIRAELRQICEARKAELQGARATPPAQASAKVPR